MLLFELDFEEVSKKKLRECWSQLCRIRCTVRKVQSCNVNTLGIKQHNKTGMALYTKAKPRVFAR